jgi:tetratricopeptide (TPR) repeat protein
VTDSGAPFDGSSESAPRQSGGGERRTGGPSGQRRTGVSTSGRKGGTPRQHGGRTASDPRGGSGDGQRRDRDPGQFDNSERRGGSRLAPKKPRLPDPAIPDEVTGKELDRGVHQQLRTLSKENADGVAKHLVMVAALLAAEDLEGALAHAETAARRAGRVPAAREALGMVAYRMGDYARALSEFRTVKRLSGSNHLLPVMMDCERGLGRPERALDLAGSSELGSLEIEDRVEVAIVLSGIRRDLGQLDAAEVALRIPATRLARQQPWAARLFYAQAEVALARGRQDEARELFSRAMDADQDLITDAADRIAELDGVVVEWDEE